LIRGGAEITTRVTSRQLPYYHQDRCRPEHTYSRRLTSMPISSRCSRVGPSGLVEAEADSQSEGRSSRGNLHEIVPARRRWGRGHQNGVTSNMGRTLPQTRQRSFLAPSLTTRGLDVFRHTHSPLSAFLPLIPHPHVAEFLFFSISLSLSHSLFPATLLSKIADCIKPLAFRDTRKWLQDIFPGVSFGSLVTISRPSPTTLVLQQRKTADTRPWTFELGPLQACHRLTIHSFICLFSQLACVSAHIKWIDHQYSSSNDHSEYSINSAGPQPSRSDLTS
jgi:hypothetical protein